MTFAEECGDSASIALAKVATGFSALDLGNLDEARDLFWSTLAYLDGSFPELQNVAKVGLADYFLRTDMYDSCYYYAVYIEDRLREQSPHRTGAYATHLLGKNYMQRSDYANAILKLEQSLQSWQQLTRHSHLINNLNDLADCYLAQGDYFNARKYYLAAAKLTETYSQPAKNRYDINLNLRFLQQLSSDDYLRAGEEASKLVEEL